MVCDNEWPCPAIRLCDYLDSARVEISDQHIVISHQRDMRHAQKAELDDTRTRLDEIRAFHQMTVSDSGKPCGADSCDACGLCGCGWDMEHDGPCPTTRILDRP